MIAVVDDLDTDPAQFGREIATYVLAEIHAIASKPASVETKDAKIAGLPARARRAVETAATMRKGAGWSHAKAEAWYQRALTAYADAISAQATAPDEPAA